MGLASLADVIGTSAGIPSRASDAPSWSMPESFLLLIGYLLAFAFALWLVSWLDVKLTSRTLFREIYRELGIGRRPRR